MLTFSVKDFNGIEYCGTTKYIDEIKKDEKITVEYDQVIPLKPERYTLSLGCVKINNDGETEVYDRLYDCILFQIVSTEGMLGLFKLDSEVVIKK